MSADFVCPHEAWEERNGGWRKCSDCGYGWSAPKATQPPASDAVGGERIEKYQHACEVLSRLMDGLSEKFPDLPECDSDSVEQDVLFGLTGYIERLKALTQPGEVVAWVRIKNDEYQVQIGGNPHNRGSGHHGPWIKTGKLTYADTREVGEERQRAEAAEPALKVAVGELIALVPSVYMAHHKEDNTQTRAREAFNRCREMTIQNIQTHFAIKAAQPGRGGEG